MRLMLFEPDVYFRLLARYNFELLPTVGVALILAVGLLVLSVKPSTLGRRLIAAGLAVFWLWTGLVFHGLYCAAINWVAWGFGALFAVQGLVLAWTGVLRGHLEFGYPGGARGWAKLVLAISAIAGQPIFQWLSGAPVLQVPFAGTGADPTVVFTTTLMAMTKHRVPRHVLILPALWLVLAGIQAWLLASTPGVALIAAGFLGLGLVLGRPQKATAPTQEESEP